MVRRIFWKQLDVFGSTMGAPDDFRSMLALVTASKLESVVDRVFPLDEAVKAFQRMEEWPYPCGIPFVT
jgi:zinc-binding alcohol dehydrogenase/oxidoreductase